MVSLARAASRASVARALAGARASFVGPHKEGFGNEFEAWGNTGRRSGPEKQVVESRSPDRCLGRSGMVEQSERDDDSYYPGTLRLVYMLLLSNTFPEGC